MLEVVVKWVREALAECRDHWRRRNPFGNHGGMLKLTTRTTARAWLLGRHLAFALPVGQDLQGGAFSAACGSTEASSGFIATGERERERWLALPLTAPVRGPRTTCFSLVCLTRASHVLCLVPPHSVDVTST